MINLPIRPIYLEMLKEIEAPENLDKGQTSKAKKDLAKIVERVIHDNYHKGEEETKT